MLKYLVGICALLMISLASASPIDCPPIPDTFVAEYNLYRNGKLLGVSTSELKRLNNTQFLYSIKSVSTRGLAAFLGVKVSQSSNFTLNNGMIVPSQYRYFQKISFSKDKDIARYNWLAMEVKGTENKDNYQHSLTLGAQDPASVNLHLLLAVCNQETSLTVQVIDGRRIKTHHYLLGEAETVKVPAGSFSSIKSTRLHTKPHRKTIAWHSPKLQFLPVKVEHQDKKNRMLMELKSIRFDRQEN